jgi:hypothetical protein
MNPELGRLIVSGKRNLLKFISFLPTPECPNYLQKIAFCFLVIALIEPAVVFPFAGLPQPAIDSPWTLELKHNDAKIRSEIPLLTEQDER